MTPVERVARELGMVLRSLKGLHAQTTAEAGVRLELPATAVLTTLDDRGRMRPSALAEALHLDLSSVSRQVASLEREGLVRRERDPADSRAALLELTPAGREVLGRVRAARVEQLHRMLPDWTEPELRAFADSLHRFRTDLARGSAERAPSRPGQPPLPRPTPDRDPALTGQERA